MKKRNLGKMFVCSALVLTLTGGLAGGCVAEEDDDFLEDDIATTAKAATTSNPIIGDASFRWQYTYNTYKDIAVDSSAMYLVRTSDGATEKRYISSPGTAQWTSLTNFSAIDYVNSNWGVVASRNGSYDQFYIGVFGTGSASMITVDYPSSLSSVSDIAAYQDSSNSNILWVFLRGPYDSTETSGKTVYGYYTRNVGMSWVGTVDSNTNYISSLFCRTFGSTNYLMNFYSYYTSAFQRRVGPNGARSSEDLGSYDSHSYYVGNPLYAYDSITSVQGIDYANGKYYILDTCSGNGYTHQCLVTLDDEDIDF